MLEATGLECVRGERRLFGELSFSLKGGALLRVAGANGSGKTSLLRILCGLLAPTSGEVRWEGNSIQSLKEDYSRRLLYLGHAPAVKDDLSPVENLAIACRIAGRDAGEKEIHAALGEFGVPRTEILTRRLSQGQRRRAALARLLLSKSAPLWLLDEPFAALDADAARFTESLIAEHAARGAMVIYTTHQAAAIDGGARGIDLGAA